jgi:uroporphyrinogen decarboxylase
MDQPDLLADLLATIAAWNEQRMRVILEAGVDLFIRRAWYESADFWSPRLHRQFLLPTLKREVELAHEHGTPFGYIMTSNALPMLDNILEAGVDVLIGVDPLQHGVDTPLQVMRDKLGGRAGLWGGVNGAITVEEGTADDVRAAVAHALDVMRGINGFILSPVDNITEITLNTWRNVDVFIEAWKQLRG